MDATFYQSSSPLLQAGNDQKVAYFHLYLHQIICGVKDENQAISANPNRANLFGLVAVNDWTVREGREPDSRVVARAQGLHTGSAKDKEQWYCSFNMLFEDERYVPK
jgi:Dirigent-like protein